MTQDFFVGVDGGATKSIVRLEDSEGRLLGRQISGPASLRLSVDQSWQSIKQAFHQLCHSLSLSAQEHRFHAGMGLAGCELKDAKKAFMAGGHEFTHLLVTSDAHIAHLGAHDGADGAIIIAGTGVAGYQICQGQVTRAGGWGFPHDDIGGGAWLGLQAVSVTLQWLDGRLPQSKLAQAVYAHFKQDQEYLVRFANQANSSAFAELAPHVIQQSQQGDTTASTIMQRAAQALAAVLQALTAGVPAQQPPLSCALVGSVAPFLEPYFDSSLRARLCSAKAVPDAGAVLFIRQYLDEIGTADYKCPSR